MVKWAGKDSREIAGLRLALTGVNPHPLRLDNLEEFNGREMDMKVLGELCARVNRKAKPMRTTTVEPAYRRSMVGALVEKAAARLAPELAEALAARHRWGQQSA